MRTSCGWLRPLRGPGALLVTLLTLTGGVPRDAGAQAPRLRIAVMDFTSEDNVYPNSLAAADFSSAVQASLSNEPGFDLVEREQLHKARQEMELGLLNRAGADAVRSGRLLKADFLVLGRFTPEEKDGWTLSLELIDLDHAEVAARRRVTLGVGSEQPLRAGLPKTAAATPVLRELMAAGRDSRARRTGQIAIAPLFFANLFAGVGFRPQGAEGLQQFEETFITLLEQTAATNARLRLVQYPRASRALDESEMILAGLIAADSNAWQRVADVFVWGMLTNVPPPFGQKNTDGRVDAVLTVWDGRTEPRVLRERLDWPKGGAVPASAISRLTARFAEFTLAKASQHGFAPVSEALRKRVAASIVDGVLALRGSGPGTSPLGMGLSDPAGRREFTQIIQMLETACFFDPGNRQAQELLVRHRWGNWMLWRPGGRQFWTVWRRSEAWGRYVEQFGLESRTGGDDDFVFRDGLPDQYLASSAELLDLLSTGMKDVMSGFPKGVPREVEARWRQELAEDHVRRFGRVAEFAATGNLKTNTARAQFTTTVWLDGVLRGLLTERKQWPAGKRLEWIERILPRFHALTNADNTRLVQSLHAALATAYAKAGRPAPASLRPAAPSGASPSATARPAVAGTPPGFVVSASSNPAPVAILDMPRLEAPPPALHPVIAQAGFPKSDDIFAVPAMVFHRDRLWLLAGEWRARDSFPKNPELSADLRPSMTRLWSCDAGMKELQRVGALESRTIEALWPDGDRLWLAGDGLHTLDLRTLATERIGVAQGLNENRFHALGKFGGRLHVAGGQVYTRDTTNGQWEMIPGPRQSMSYQPVALAEIGRWLLFTAGAMLLHDSDRQTWTNLTDISRQIAGNNGGPLRVSVATDPPGGVFWIGAASGLHRLDPATLAMRAFPVATKDPPAKSAVQGMGQSNDARLVNQQVVKFYERLRDARASAQAWDEQFAPKARTFGTPRRLCGAVTALADDGEFLWVATGWPGRTAVLLLHKATEQWLGGFDMPATIDSLAVSDRHLWIGGRAIWRVEKEPLLRTPRDEWMPDAVTQSELDRLLAAQPVRAQAIHAFFSGDYERVERLLDGQDLARADIATLFLIGFSSDTLGLNNPERARRCFEEIVRREADSPWATIARSAVRANDGRVENAQRQARLLERFDHNHDGQLNDQETRAMERDPAYQREQEAAKEVPLRARLEKIIGRYDRNRDGRLELQELTVLQTSASRFSKMDQTPQIEERAAPFRWAQLTNATGWLDTGDLDKDGRISADELEAVWRKAQKQ